MLMQFYLKELLHFLIPKDDIVLPRFLLESIHLWTAVAAGTMSNHNILNERIRCRQVLNAMETEDLLHFCNYHQTLPQILDFKMLRTMLVMVFRK